MQIQPSNSVMFKKTGQATDTNKDDAKLQKASHDFEAIIMQQMLTAMRKSVPKDGLFGDGYAQDMYQSMYDESLAQQMSSGKGIGLADTIYKQLSGIAHSSAK
jgi:flagellar protein FlgJ